MKKNKFIESTILLVIGGFITKILGMIIKIIMTKQLGTEGIGLYMMIAPTFMVLIAIAQLGFPVAISTLVAAGEKNNHKLILSLIPISLFINLLFMVLIILIAPYLANNLLHDSRLYYPIMAISLVLPFITISSIMRGYFLGKQYVFPHVISLILEDIVWLIVLMIGIPYFLKMGVAQTLSFIILSNIISELTSIIILYIFLPKKTLIKKEYFSPKDSYLKDVFTISLPVAGSRLIGTIGYFFEPIIITYVLLKVGYSNSYIVNEYGIINGYIGPLLLIPSFITLAISQSLIPVVSSYYASKNFKYIKYKIAQALKISLSIGIPITIIFLLFPSYILKLIYNNVVGVEYLKIMAPFYLLLYIQYPLISVLQAMKNAKKAMNGTLVGMITRTIILFGASFLKIGMGGLVISIIFNIIFVTIYQSYNVYKLLK